MQDNRELKEAVMYRNYSLAITITSIPFSVMGFILRDSSSFAIEMMSLGIVGFFVGLVSLLIWHLKWKKLSERNEV
jgi:hypothetical protein